MDQLLETASKSVLAPNPCVKGERPDAGLDESWTIRRVAPGDRILDYRILATLGRGGFGEVFRAEHELLRRVVAIKVPHDEECLPALSRSARIQAAIDDRSVVRALEASLSHNPPYVVFEHVDGPSLADLILKGGPLPWARALPLLQDVARALAVSHKHGFVHGDVKPANVLVETDGELEPERARLTDFGSVGDRSGVARGGSPICSSIAVDTAWRSEITGTLPYLAPEVLRGHPADERADVYAFGVLLFEVLTGHLPEGRELPSALVSGIPSELDRAFDRCFVRHVRRAASLDEILLLLEGARPRPAPAIQTLPGAPRAGLAAVLWSCLEAIVTGFNPLPVAPETSGGHGEKPT